jgi:hypothetical protein
MTGGRVLLSVTEPSEVASDGGSVAEADLVSLVSLGMSRRAHSRLRPRPASVPLEPRSRWIPLELLSPFSFQAGWQEFP